MPLRDRLLALAVAVIWGLNFPAIHLSLEQFPPFFLVVLRFALIAVPTLLLVPRPAVPWRWVLGYGAGFGVLQFLFLYLAMDTGMPTGLASLVLQSSAPFTVVLAGFLLRERLTARQVAGVGLAVAGLGGIAVHRADLGGGATLLPVVLTLCGGLGWALGNLCNRQARTVEPFRLMLWMTVVPPLPMLAASLLVEGPSAIGTSLTTLGTTTGAFALAGLAFTVVVATVVGSGIWTWLMSRHPSSTVAPFSMLVPVVGIGTSWLAFGEPLYAVELACGVVVVAGVLLGSSGGRAAERPVDGRLSGPAARPSGREDDVTVTEPLAVGRRSEERTAAYRRRSGSLTEPASTVPSPPAAGGPPS
ncbi:EamA family transporter [Geodermatophilus sabuli]|uniref:O-acetylserine/cysteine efflux transporter n=1 Tax=Geodermatophilus sabuli TaxID=1564158 RepID=A0A285EHC1_9ACTN|nr:EamA family transporter [Geodermatophilus sabuli]MBB3083867.1 O-acetylserine/cysteine efflux transporter [Geodermatophilus sabuli]SNX98518.1 O-acetylserine/cysteine efflux transporter [Geodermatophilus sabuli]